MPRPLFLMMPSPVRLQGMPLRRCKARVMCSPPDDYPLDRAEYPPDRADYPLDRADYPPDRASWQLRLPCCLLGFPCPSPVFPLFALSTLRIVPSCAFPWSSPGMGQPLKFPAAVGK